MIALLCISGMAGMWGLIFVLGRSTDSGRGFTIDINGPTKGRTS